MTCGEAVKDYLKTLAPVTALVNTRIWMRNWPQKPTLPGVLVTQIGDGRTSHLRGSINLMQTRIQIDCLAENIKDARALDQAVMGSIVNGAPTGLLNAVATVGSPGITITVTEAIFYMEGYDAEELKQAKTTRHYRVWYEE